MRKVLTIVGTRPELIKMSRVIDRLDNLCDHVLVHTGQNYDYELNKVFFDDLGIRKPDHFLDVAEPTPAATIAKIISSSDLVLEREQPDAVLIYGDTNSGLSAISAKRRKIPIFHMEAGNRCFDQRVPEELNRKLIDHLSDINIVLTEHARRYLLAEGFPPDRVFKVGSHLSEVIEFFRPKIDASKILDTMELEPGQFFVVSVHREENVDVPERLSQLLETLNCLAEEYGFPIVMSTHPRTRNRLAELEFGGLSPLVRLLPPFGYTDYVRLQLEAFCIISDSGTITEEASLLDLPAVTVRDAHERPEGMDAGTLVMSPLSSECVLYAVKVARDGLRDSHNFAGSVNDYEGGEVSTKVVRIVLSYIDFVNRVVWRRS